MEKLAPQPAKSSADYAQKPLQDLGLAAYRPLPGVPDELMDTAGHIRPVWQPLIDHLTGMSSADMAERTTRADQYLRDSGVFYRQYGAGQSEERPWPLSHIPILIEEREWQQLSQGLVQRADLLEAMMADFYGPNEMVAKGFVPQELVAANPEWLRPLVGVEPASGHFLHFVAFELGRGPNGQWWVLSDRTQAPSGVGYALENRVAMSRAFSDIFAEQNVHRLAGFFRNFRDHLLSLRGPREGRAAILSPGPLNDTYFEQAWLARYLGFALVQGEDLSVAQGQLMLRTVSGLKPIDVLWRRLDGGYADPLELDAHSRIGVAGMVSALRRGGLTMVNALGSGLLETRALMDVMAQLSQQLLGAPLQLPNVASWWYGDGPSDPQSPPQPERMPLSTTPALVAGELVPRPMSLRVFVARTASGWQVMQGGFARIGASADPSALAMQRGGTAADVWILSQADVPSDTMVAPPPGPYRRHAPDALPARAADNLFWMGRYVERCENMLRLLRARHIRSAEGGASHPLMALIDRQLSTFGIDGPAPHLPQALLQTIGAAVASAAKVRDRFSPDAWSALHDLDKTTRRMAQSLHPGDDAARGLSALLRKLAGFSGLVHDNMYRFHGWGFLSIGRMQERGLTMANHLAVLCDPKAPAGALDLCIELGDSVLIHRQRFTIGSTRQTVVDLLGLDPMNPRSLRYQCETMASLGLTLPGTSHHGQLSELGRALVRLQADVATQTPESLDSAALAELAAHLAALSDLITEAYLR